MFRTLLALVFAGLAALHAAPPAAAQDYPTRPVRIVFPLAAGGGGDVFTRALADELQKAWHQPVVVENRPGGSQNIGARACVEATPDGDTICVMSSEPAVGPRDEFIKFIASNRAFAAKVAKDAGIKPQ